MFRRQLSYAQTGRREGLEEVVVFVGYEGSDKSVLV